MSSFERSRSSPVATLPAWLIGIGAGIIGCVLLWMGHARWIEALQIAGATFDFPERRLAGALLLYFGVGVTFAVVVLLSRGQDHGRRAGLLVGAALAPVGLLLFFWDWLGPRLLPSSLTRRMLWALDGEVQAVAAIAVAVLLTTLIGSVFRVGERHTPEPSEATDRT